MIRYLQKLQKNLIWAIPISMALGLIGGGFLFDAAPLKKLIIPITFIMVYPMMATLNVKSIFTGKDVKLQITTQIINFILIPTIVFGLGKLFLQGEELKYGLWAVGLFLIGVLPASGMTISWTGFAKGNKEAATKMLVFGLFIGALAAPVYTKVFMGATVNVDMLHMFQQICLFVFVPLIGGLLTQRYLIKKRGKEAWMNVYKTKISALFGSRRYHDCLCRHVFKGKNDPGQPIRPADYRHPAGSVLPDQLRVIIGHR